MSISKEEGSQGRGLERGGVKGKGVRMRWCEGKGGIME